MMHTIDYMLYSEASFMIEKRFYFYYVTNYCVGKRIEIIWKNFGKNVYTLELKYKMVKAAFPSLKCEFILVDKGKRWYGRTWCY